MHGARGRLCQPGGIALMLLLLPHLHLSCADAAQAAELLCSGHIIPVFTAVLGLASALLIPPGSRGQKFSKRKVSCRAKGVPPRTRCPAVRRCLCERHAQQPQVSGSTWRCSALPHALAPRSALSCCLAA